MKALAENDRAEARACLRDLTELLGLAAAERHELAGPGGRPLGGSIGERAPQFLRRPRGPGRRLGRAGEGQDA